MVPNLEALFEAYGASCAPLVCVTAAEMLTMKLPPQEMLLAPWLPGKGLAMVYGPRGIGKTHLSLGIAYAAATGGAFLRWQAPVPRRVLVVDGEMPVAALQERLAEVAASSPLAPPAPGYLRFLAMDMQDRGLDLSDVGSHPALADAMGDAELVIVDNISTLASAGGRENEADGWQVVQQWALQQRRAGRSVVFIHHAGKGGQQRGTSRREDVLNTVVALRRPADYDPAEGARFEVHFEKARGFQGGEAKPFEASLAPGAGWSTRDLVDEDTEVVAALAARGLSVRQIAKELGMSKSAVSRLQAKGQEAE